MPSNSRNVRRASQSRFDNPVNRPAPNQPEARAQRLVLAGDLNAPRKPWAWRKILHATAWTLLTLALVWIILFSGWLNLRHVSLHGATTVSEAQLQATTDEYLKQRSWERNILFTDVRALRDQYRKAYPTLTKVNINRTVFLTLQIEVRETAAALVWKTGGQSWLVSTDGQILRPATGKDKVAGTVTDTAQLAVEAGKKVANGGFISFVLDSYKAAGKYQLTIKDVTRGETTQEASLTLDNGISIKADTTESAESQLEAAQKTFRTATETKKPVTQYIDTRIPGRTFYK